MIFIGYDPRPVEAQAFAVARSSIFRHLFVHIELRSVVLAKLRRAGLYTRPTEWFEGRMWDVISEHTMATEFAISRFLVPHLANLEGHRDWAAFVDGDVMARVCMGELFRQRDPNKACMVVKHDYTPKSGFKMDNQIQSVYERKNWSSVTLWNLRHPGTLALTPEVVNRERGLWLHQFTWLDDKDIGALDPAWNHLVDEMEPNPQAKLVHFTRGPPNLDEHRHDEFAGEWRAELEDWAA